MMDFIWKFGAPQVSELAQPPSPSSSGGAEHHSPSRILLWKCFIKALPAKSTKSASPTAATEGVWSLPSARDGEGQEEFLVTPGSSRERCKSLLRTEQVLVLQLSEDLLLDPRNPHP